MLTRLEGIYLHILRFAILTVAGLALLVAITALALSVFNGLKGLTLSASDADAGGLAGFIAEKRLAAETSSDATSTTNAQASREPVPLADPIGHAANTFARYLNQRARNTVRTGELVQILNERWLDTPAGYHQDYEARLRSVADELAASTGRPLNRDGVLELIEWHHRSLMSSISRLEQERQLTSARTWTWVERGVQAFLLFVAIAFCFLLVRIERHLRLVRTQSLDPSDEATGVSEEGIS